jgi:capsular polysaccharide biosynthesis protein
LKDPTTKQIVKSKLVLRKVKDILEDEDEIKNLNKICKSEIDKETDEKIFKKFLSIMNIL